MNQIKIGTYGYKDITGMKFGRLMVLRRVHFKTPGRWAAMFNCLCDCGQEYVAYGHSLRYGRTQSCGCLRADRTKEYWNKVKSFGHGGDDKMPEFED
jgi:hypothetical protein